MSPPISIVMRSKNDGPLIGQTLQAVYDQDYPGRVELVHIDSGSTDRTVEVIRATHPHQLIQIPATTYVPGRVLNQGMRESTSAWVVFLNSDAEPADRHWLSALLAAAHVEPQTGAAFSRQIPRPDCQAVFAHDYERCFGEEHESLHGEHFFSMASCVVNRAAWEAQPFREDLQYAEDDEWARRVKGAGWKIQFAESSVAIHSHNYSLGQAYRRSYGDHFALAAVHPERPAVGRELASALLGSLHEMGRDAAWCLHQRRLAEWPQAIGVRLGQRLGKVQGLWEGWRHYHGDRRVSA